jgi:hypothetical protein
MNLFFKKCLIEFYLKIKEAEASKKSVPGYYVVSPCIRHCAFV